ncbi:HalOD1 output domain-containing protein [Haloarchaeobius baliensis]|uniref:HalOD1 output domain-containing protein n=1 Tax=Haloarchaeobius baliensis TaxID=1670458 RepID=UPI003F881BCB
MTRTDLVTGVVEAVAAADGVAMADVPQLHDYIDPEILAKLGAQQKLGNCRVTFQFADHQVTVTQASEIIVDGERYIPENVVN